MFKMLNGIGIALPTLVPGMDALELPAAAVLLQRRAFRKAELVRPIDDFQSNSSSLNCETARARNKDRERKGKRERECVSGSARESLRPKLTIKTRIWRD